MTISLVDSHCHLNFEPLQQDLDRVLADARQMGVGHMLCVSVNLESFPEVLALAVRYPHIYASVGVHPNERDGREPDAAELVRLADHPRVVAIGETGLDYYRSETANATSLSRGPRLGPIGDGLEWQRERFRCHIRAARQAGKPLIIHTREASEDTLQIMREEEAGSAGGVMHCFTESWDVAKASLDLGFYISFSGIVTFRTAEALREVARRVPDDRLLVETDAPYLAPVPHRGKTNEPAYVAHVARQVAELRGSTTEALAELTTRNFFKLFRTAQAVAA